MMSVVNWRGSDMTLAGDVFSPSLVLTHCGQRTFIQAEITQQGLIVDDRDTSRNALIFAMPFLQKVGWSRLEKATSFTMRRWNLALLPEDKRMAHVEELTSMFAFAASWFPEHKDGAEELRL